MEANGDDNDDESSTSSTDNNGYLHTGRTSTSPVNLAGISIPGQIHPL